MITLGTQQIGNKLVRSIGEGKNLKRVITEVVDGKILTHVFDSEGNRFLSRAKQFSEDKVGDKFVKTTTKVVNSRGRSSVDIEPDKFSRTVIDRVYDNNGKLVGSRAVFENGDSIEKMAKVAVSKQGSDDIRLTKYFSTENGRVTSKEAVTDTNAGAVYELKHSGMKMNYNDKGFPMPEIKRNIMDVIAPKRLPSSDMSLRQMIDWKNVNYPKDSYTRPEFKLQNLDIVDAKTTLSAIKNNGNIDNINNMLGAFLNKTV